MGGYAQGIRNLGGQINQVSTMSERLNNQWRAIGTTIRYAIAGQAVFGIARMVTQLKDMQVQMGLIAAIGSQPGPGGVSRSFTGGDVNSIIADSRKGAVQSLTPVKDYTDAVINLLSTVQNVPKDQITPIVTQISQASQLAQISAEDATKAFTTMNVAFGKPTNLANIRRTAQEFFILTQQAPGGISAGQQVVGQLGQLAQVTRAAGGTQQDMFSLLLTTLRSGIPPAQAGRGLQFLIQTLAFPGQQSTSARQALASVGIQPGTNLTLQQRLARVFGRARGLGLGGAADKLTVQTLAGIDPEADTTDALRGAGITGRGTEFLGKVFHRIHALRTALAISGQIDVGQAQRDLILMQQAAQGHVSDVNSLSKAWTRFSNRTKLKQASVALNALSLQVAQIFEPVMNLAAKGIIATTSAAQRHPGATRDIAIGGAALLGAMGIGRFLGAGNLPGVRRIPGLSRILGGGPGRAFVMANAAQAAVSGNTALGASPQNPLYVVVVGQLFGGGTPGPAGAEAGAARAARGSRLFGWGKNVLKAVGGGSVALGGATAAMAAADAAALGALIFKGGGDQGPGTTVLARAQQLFGRTGRVTGIESATSGRFHGRAEIFLTLDQIDPTTGKKKVTKVHVPIDMWKNGSHPTQGGKVTQKGRGH